MENHLSIPTAAHRSLPSVGLGFWKIPNASTAQLAVEAAKIGYRHFDCASDYGNEPEVGQGISKILQSGLCRREDLWVTGKLWNTYHRKEHVRRACERTLADLQLDYLDLYLIHFPIALAYVPFEHRYPAGWSYDPESKTPKMIPDAVPIHETWEAMERLVQSGLVRTIGISNFCISLIRDLLSYASLRPSVLQVESHPYLVQNKLLKYCKQEQIALTAFSPLGAPSYVPLGMATAADSVIEQPLIQQIARQVDRTPAQVVLRWGVQRGTAVIPKTERIERLKENLSLFDFELTQEQMELISGLDRNQRFNDPGVFCQEAFGCYYPIYE
jgi:D-xylose reductase